MPFRKWKVEPVFLSRKPLPPDKPIFETSTNGTLVKCMEQMASLLKLADRIFDEIGSECRLVFERTQKLRVKVEICEDAVANLDAKIVQVPVSDLENTVQLLRRPQFVTHYDQTNQLFLPSTRPPAVDELYGKASATPVPLISTIDRYRSDGRKGSQLFMVTPILGDAERRKRKNRKMLDIETRRPASFALAKDWQEDDDCGTLVCGSGQAIASTSSTLQQRIKEDGLERLPSPEELALAASLEYPSSVVPVDTTGSSFLRMSKSRRSLIHVDFFIRRKKKKKTKRRHTVCEGSSKELEDAIRNISVTDTSCQTEEVPEVGSLSSSFRRSFSRRRGRATVDNVLRETDRSNVEGTKKSGKASSPAIDDDKDISANKENTLSTRKPAKLSLKSRNFINPISSLSAALSIAVKMRHSSRTSGKQDDGRSSSGNWSASSSTRASVDSDQHQVITPVDCTSSVSRNSVGKDSVLSDATQVDTNIRLQDGVSVSPKHLPLLKSSLLNQSEEKKDNELWSLEIDQGRQSSTSTPERASDSTNTSVALSPYLIRKGAPRNLPVTGSLDDGESSVYSVDTDGYYTSMHTDSGLWNAVAQSVKLGDSVVSESFKFRRRRESQSSVSTIGNSSINSFLSRTATEVSSNQSSLKRQKPAPQPPPRLSSAPHTPKENTPMPQNEIVKESEVEGSEKSSSPLPFPNGSTSESDYEARDRIQLKTKINSSRYPSMCAVSPETSDDDALETTSFRENIKSPVINVVVADVHREENPNDVQNVKTSSPAISVASKEVLEPLKSEDLSHEPASSTEIQASSSQSPIINMYGSHSPVQSSFSSSLVTNDFSHSSPLNAKCPVSSFFPNTSEINSESNDSVNYKTASLFPPKQAAPAGEKFLSDSLVSPHDVPRTPGQSVVPLKYAPRITVTPITRIKTDSPVNKISGVKSNSPQPHSYTSDRMAMSNSSCSAPNRSTVQYRNVNVSQSLNPRNTSDIDPVVLQRNYSCSSVQSLRPVARVTLDPTGRVVYSSRSLDRKTNDAFQGQGPLVRCNSRPLYATLPMYQGHCSSSCVPENSEYHSNLSSSKTDAVTTDLQQPKGNRTPNPDFTPVDENIPLHSADQRNNMVCQTQKWEDSSGFHQYPEALPSSRARDLYFRPSRGGRFCRTYFPPHLISSPPPANKEPQVVQQMVSLKSFTNDHSHFGNQAAYKSDSRRSDVMNTVVNKSNMASQYLNRTNNTGGFPEAALPETTTLRGNYQNSYNSSFRRRNYIQSPDLGSNPRNSHETHFRPLNPAASGLRYSTASNSYCPQTFTSFDSYRKISPANCIRAVSPVSNETVHDFQPSVSLSYYQGKSAVPYLDEDDSSSQYSSVSFDSGDASQEFAKPCSSVLHPQPPDVIPSSASPRSTLDITSPSSTAVQGNKLHKSKCDEKPSPLHTPVQSTPLKSLSANELFAIIHNSKKKHNIKTESEKSLSPLSSRSSSPGIGLTPVKGVHVETGVLGRRNGTPLKPGDRHSWDGNQSFIVEKKSLAQDRLGRSKPTSMHDFKMLLLQARGGSSDSSPRPSAAELLKVSHPQNVASSSSPSRSLTSSPVKSIPLSKPQSPILTHSTLPLKRAARTRSPFLTRYDSAYPPILEDCSEESESVSDRTTTDHLISRAQSNAESSEGCEKHHFSDDTTNVHESNKPNSKATSTWV